MPRPRTLLSNEFPYHVSARCNNREAFPGDLAYTWRTLTNELYLQTITRKVSLHAFVLMPNHFHLLISTPNWQPDNGDGIQAVMRDFLSSSTRILNTKNRRSGRLMGQRYYWSLIRDPQYFAHATKYVYRNPVKAGLSYRVEEYEFSTLGSLYGRGVAGLPITSPRNDLDCYIPKDSGREEFLSWLNQAHRAEEAAAIRMALRRKEFEIFPNQKTRRAVALTMPPGF